MPLAAIAIEAREIFRLILNIDPTPGMTMFFEVSRRPTHLDRNLT